MIDTSAYKAFAQTETISDLDMRLEWNRIGDHLKVVLTNGTLLYQSSIGYASPQLSARQVKWIQEDYNRKKKNYVFKP